MTTARVKTNTPRDDIKAASAAAAQLGAAQLGANSFAAQFGAGKFGDVRQNFSAMGEASAKSFDQAVQITKEQVEKAAQMAFQRYDEMTVFSKENVDAVVKSGTVFAKGFEDIAKAFMSLAQQNLEASVGAAKAVMGCTTLRQVVDLQTETAKSQFDKMVAEGNKLSEMSLKVANEALEPIQARVNLAVEKFVKPVAA